MCRLLGFVSKTPVTLAELLGESELAEFTELSIKHGDGWGFTWSTPSGVEVVKSPDAARESSLFQKIATEQKASLGVLHLRWATLNLPVQPENTHPFTDGHIGFAHNGSIEPPESLDSMIPAKIASLRRGTTDSERYFLATLAAIENGNTGAALGQTAARIAANRKFSSLNAMIAGPTRLDVVNLFSPDAEALEDEPDYYQMGFRRDADAVVVASSGWGSGWSHLINRDLLTVDHETRDLTISQVRDLGEGGS